MFKGKFFGDVIAGIAKDGRNTLVLWCQFDGGCELRLSAMATMVDDEMLCDALGDRETMVLLDRSQREIDAGRMPPELHMIPPRQKMRSASTRMDGYSR